MKKITVIGGDKRLKIAVKELTDKGFEVNTVGLYDDEKENTYGDVLLLPVPTTKDGETVFAPFARRKIYLSEVADKADNRLLLTCNYSFKDKNCIDYGALDSYSLLVDEDGYLPQSFTNGDGLHLSDVALNKVVEIMRTHPIPD